MTFWPLPPAELPAIEKSVDVWAIRLDDDKFDLQRAREIVSDDERKRAERFKFERDRRRYLIAHAALHGILGRYLTIRSEPINFDYGSNGKPKLSQALTPSGVQFNLSHSNEMAVLALTRGGEVGVDIEFVKDNFEFQDVAERFFRTKEVAAMRSLPAHLQRRAFFKCWTSKEAFLKAKGSGLSGKLDEVEITLTANQQVQITASVPGWTLAELEPIDGYEAALVVEGAPLPISHYLWQI
jgi:4'-phosphopantetheinyl transferase